MKKNLKLTLAALTVLTVIYLAVVVHAQTARSPYNTGYDMVIRAARAYTEEPDVWYTYQELGIIAIDDFGLTDETWNPHCSISIGVKPEKVEFLDEESPIFKYKDWFWKVSSLLPYYRPAEDPNRWQLPAGALLGSSWVVTGVFLFHRKRKMGKLSTVIVLMLSKLSWSLRRQACVHASMTESPEELSA